MLVVDDVVLLLVLLLLLLLLPVLFLLGGEEWLLGRDVGLAGPAVLLPVVGVLAGTGPGEPAALLSRDDDDDDILLTVVPCLLATTPSLPRPALVLEVLEEALFSCVTWPLLV